MQLLSRTIMLMFSSVALLTGFIFSGGADNSLVSDTHSTWQTSASSVAEVHSVSMMQVSIDLIAAIEQYYQDNGEYPFDICIEGDIATGFSCNLEESSLEERLIEQGYLSEPIPYAEDFAYVSRGVGRIGHGYNDPNDDVNAYGIQVVHDEYSVEGYASSSCVFMLGENPDVSWWGWNYDFYGDGRDNDTPLCNPNDFGYEWDYHLPPHSEQ